MKHHFNSKKQLTNYGYSGFATWQTFLKNEPSESVISKKTTDSICCNDKTHSFKQKSIILENLDLAP